MAINQTKPIKPKSPVYSKGTIRKNPTKEITDNNILSNSLAKGDITKTLRKQPSPMNSPDIKNLISSLFKDSDSVLIILLIVLLMDNEENFFIVLMLLYLLA